MVAHPVCHGPGLEIALRPLPPICPTQAGWVNASKYRVDFLAALFAAPYRVAALEKRLVEQGQLIEAMERVRKQDLKRLEAMLRAAND